MGAPRHASIPPSADMEGIGVDRSNWPIVQYHVSAPTTDEKIQYWLSCWDEDLARGQPFVTVTDLRQAAGMTALQRRMFVEWIDKNENRLRRFRRGHAMITPRLYRLIAGLVYMVKEPPFPYAFFDSRAEALEWAEHQLDAADNPS